ncbi:MAG: hypothetical protein KBB61_04540 [Paludibacteraceae bacterium]|nr:hypothetical protein [Paludibacteraceae bacterium]MDI9537207.1 hypothetical protein [Bacteroidota bacterium]HHT61279.1 hypothetical protein [Bacteroidales bacterium]MBP9039223.1 hypothetical protein [Paludibacteraceae bacterium]HOA46306.1 hypothetical protein [Paludibacteraceae bacterium]
MKLRNIQIFGLILLLLMTGCAYRKAAKQGAKYEQAGMYGAAVDKYLYSLSKKGNYIDARIGLMRAAKIYQEQLENKIESSYSSLNDDEVVDNYLILDNLRKKAAPFQVEITISPRTQGQYAESKNRFLITHYKEAQQNLDNENFGAAEKHLEAIINVDPTYENAWELLVISKCEPIYRTGKNLMAYQKYRSAYYQFQKILNISQTYKDTRELKDEALEKGMLTIAFLPVNNQYRYLSFYNSIVNDTKQRVQKANNPFVKIVNLDNTQQMLDEQRRAMQYGLELRTGAIIPVRAHLLLSIENPKLNVSTMQTIKKKGFIKEELPNKTIKYHKVYYNEYSRSQTYRCTFLYDLRSVESGLILLSGSSTATSADNIHYAYCEGKDNANLLSGTWEKQKSPFDPNVDKVNDSFISRTSMQMLVKSRRTLKSEQEMQQMLVNKISGEISTRLLNYNPE